MTDLNCYIVWIIRYLELMFTIPPSDCLIFDLISFHSTLLRDIHSLSHTDRHVLSNSWWLQSIVRSQEDGVNVFQRPTFGLRCEEIEDNN